MSEGKNHKKEYFTIFAVLVILTLLELGVVYTHVARGLMISALILLAIAKATSVALWYMHLKSERRALKFIVSLPAIFAAIYAIGLILEMGYHTIGLR